MAQQLMFYLTPWARDNINAQWVYSVLRTMHSAQLNLNVLVQIYDCCSSVEIGSNDPPQLILRRWFPSLSSILQFYTRSCRAGAKDHIYRMVIVEGCCTMARSSSFRRKLFIGWHKSIVSSNWSDTMVWFGQILLYFNYCHPI